MNEKRKFIILIDDENLERGLEKNHEEKLRDFSWLIDPILEQGDIVLKMAFYPDVAYPPIRKLSKDYGFYCVICPIDQSAKHVDNVDHKMEAFGKEMIFNNFDFTDLVIVGGDWDFKELAWAAKSRGKGVKFIGAKGTISGKLKELFEVEEIE